MNKTLTTSAMTLALLSFVGGAIYVAQPASASATAQPMAGSRPALRPVALPELPLGLVVPSQLPRSIRDPQFLVAWIELYNHTQPIPLWDGRTLTGRELAEFALDHELSVVWDVDNICHGGSCSQLTRTPDGWLYDQQVPGVDPIYMRPTLQNDQPGLLSALAHEIFHRTQPFGLAAPSQFEEYWAFRIGAAVAPAAWPVFDGYDPMVSGWLFLWFRDNNLGAYYPLPAYPPSIEALLAGAN